MVVDRVMAAVEAVEVEVDTVVLVVQVLKEVMVVGEVDGQTVMDLVVVEEHINQAVMEAEEIKVVAVAPEILILG
jgi:hypothetical protein